MQSVTCNNCGRNGTELVNEGPDLLLDRPGSYRLVRCRHCGLIYQNPRLTAAELETHYPSDYGPYRRDTDEQSSWFAKMSRSHDMLRRYRQIRRYEPTPGHILDIGCATGRFLSVMQDHGWQATGVELNSVAADYARETFSLRLHTGTVESARFPYTSFDAVTLWDVFEHVIDPRRTLTEIHRILKPGGLFVVSLPNPASFEARLFGSNWVGWDQPRHLHLFTPAVLDQYLKRAGLERLAIKSFSGRLAVTLLSAGLQATSWGWPESRRRLLLKLLYNWPMRVFTLPFYLTCGAYNQLTSMTIFARKRA